MIHPISRDKSHKLKPSVSALFLVIFPLSSPSSIAKHVHRVGDALERSPMLLPGSGEHVALFAEVNDGCREIVDIVREGLEERDNGSSTLDWKLRL